MKRPLFLTIWLTIMLLFSVALTADSLTYLRFIFLTKSYISLLGIAFGFVQVWAIIDLLRWRKRGVALFLTSAIVILVVTAINELAIVPQINQVLISLSIVFVVNVVILGVLYLAIKPVWKNFK